MFRERPLQQQILRLPSIQHCSGVTRSWVVEDGILQLRFTISNPQSQAVEIGALGAPLEFNSVCHCVSFPFLRTQKYLQIFTGRTADQTNNNCSLIDPYIGQDAGFVQVTPLLGTLPPLVLIPATSSPFEGWHFLPEVSSDSSYDYQSQTFEGYYEWQFHTLAFAPERLGLRHSLECPDVVYSSAWTITYLRP